MADESERQKQEEYFSPDFLTQDSFKKCNASFFKEPTGKIENHQTVATKEELYNLAVAIWEESNIQKISSQVSAIGLSPIDSFKIAKGGSVQELYRTICDIQQSDLAAFNAFPWHEYGKKLERTAENLRVLFGKPIKGKCFHIDRITHWAHSLEKDGKRLSDSIPTAYGVFWVYTGDVSIFYNLCVPGKTPNLTIAINNLLQTQIHELIHANGHSLIDKVNFISKSGFRTFCAVDGKIKGLLFNEGVTEAIACKATGLSSKSSYYWNVAVLHRITDYLSEKEGRSSEEMWQEIATMYQQEQGRDLLERRLRPYFKEKTSRVIDNLDIAAIGQVVSLKGVSIPINVRLTSLIASLRERTSPLISSMKIPRMPFQFSSKKPADKTPSDRSSSLTQ